MSYTVIPESFASLAAIWADPNQRLGWSSPFALPFWWQVWWLEFKPAAELYLGSVREGEKIIGIIPLLVKEDEASLIGNADVCDYLDFVVAPGREKDFFNVLLDDLREKGIKRLDMTSLRPDSTVMTNLVDIARSRGHEVICQPEDVTLETDLPASWEEYLDTLTAKQRHEVKRKLRRLAEAGEIAYHTVRDKAAVPKAMNTFLKMFTGSREDKASFLTARMESFFRSLADTMAGAGLLRLGVLELDKLPVAMIMGFDYRDCFYLYNSGYNRQYDSLSVGLLCKALAIKESIEEGKKKFDFLKGNELYKYHLGGKEVPLSRCQITSK